MIERNVENPASIRVEPFSIAVPQVSVSDLMDRLARARWPHQIDGIGWDQGTERDYLRSLIDYWRENFDWRLQERTLNQLPQFRASIGSQQVHFIHVRAKSGSGLPILITHGWPGAFTEMVKIIPMLTDPESYGGHSDDAFDVIVPSLPGYGFSSIPCRIGMDTFEIAKLWAELMAGLGYRRFAAQGGDWGAYVATCLGLLFPERVIGLHLNRIPGGLQPPCDPSGKDLTEDERAFVAAYSNRWMDAEGAYARIQATRPQSLAYAFNDSPVGLAAWMVEKFRAWSDCNGEVERVFTKDELLTFISIYWFTQTISSSMRLYWEARRNPLRFESGEQVRVPCAVAVFPKEIVMPPRTWVERVYNVQRWSRMAKGGHFAAFEQPDLLARDIRLFFRSLQRHSSKS
jgi:pimeloyl-ACP methyl ester carboxylesterase